MPEELLQRLRDIHYPDAPGWFPPAPGWWILAALFLAVLVVLALAWRKRSSARAPYVAALKLLDDAQSKRLAGTLTARAYLDESNQILKRLLIHIRHNSAAVSASGAHWLLELDRLDASTQFTNGPGAALGASRYAREVPDEQAELHKLLIGLITRLRNGPESTAQTENSAPTDGSVTAERA